MRANSLVRTNDSDVDADTVTVTAAQRAHMVHRHRWGTPGATAAANFLVVTPSPIRPDGNGGIAATVTVTLTNVETLDAVNDSRQSQRIAALTVLTFGRTI